MWVNTAPGTPCIQLVAEDHKDHALYSGDVDGLAALHAILWAHGVPCELKIVRHTHDPDDVRLHIPLNDLPAWGGD